MKKKVAIFGGSFNPPHIGHRKLIELVSDTFPCDEIWLIPSGDRRDKTIEIESRHRLELAKIFAKELESSNSPKIVVCTHELEKTDKTSTIETLQELSSLYPECEFHIIVTSELVPMIEKSWVRGKELWNTANFVVLERPGSEKLSNIKLPPNSTPLIYSVPIPEISSTDIRQIKDKEILRNSTSFELANYIISNKIYGFKETE